jgi:outer membrane lipoprotein-sorting protein
MTETEARNAAETRDDHTFRHARGTLPWVVPSALRLFLAAMALLSSHLAGPPDVFDQLYAQTLAKRQSLRSMRAQFTETTTSALLETPLVSHGTIIAAPPARVLMTYTRPERRTITLDGTSLVVVWPGRDEREKIDISQTRNRIDHYFTQATPAQLRSMFDIHAEPDAGVPDTIRVAMRPKRKAMREGLERLELWIDRESLVLTQMLMTFPGGETKRITLDSIETNVPVTDETFRIRP